MPRGKEGWEGSDEDFAELGKVVKNMDSRAFEELKLTVYLFRTFNKTKNYEDTGNKFIVNFVGSLGPVPPFLLLSDHPTETPGATLVVMSVMRTTTTKMTRTTRIAVVIATPRATGMHMVRISQARIGSTATLSTSTSL